MRLLGIDRGEEMRKGLSACLARQNSKTERRVPKERKRRELHIEKTGRNQGVQASGFMEKNLHLPSSGRSKEKKKNGQVERRTTAIAHKRNPSAMPDRRHLITAKRYGNDNRSETIQRTASATI